MSFDKQFTALVDYQVRCEESEERKRRIARLGHAERLFLQEVWWPAIGSFEYLHPEYEVSDFKDGTRFLDFAYIRFPLRICFEIDGYGPHSRDLSRWQFADQLMRQNHLIIDGWRVIRFSYDDIAEKPRRCQQLIQQLIGSWFGSGRQPAALTATEHKIVRYAIGRQAPFSPAEASAAAGVSERQTRTLLHRLLGSGVLVPVSGGMRIRTYMLNEDSKKLFL